MNRSKKSHNYRLEELRMSDNLLQQLFNGVPMAFALCEIILDKKGKPVDYCFLKINSEFENYTGLPQKSIVSKTAKELFSQIEQTRIDKYWSVVLNKTTSKFIDYNHNTDKYYNLKAFSLSDNKFALLYEHVTKNELAKDAKKKSEEKYSRLFNSMSEMFQVVELIYDFKGTPVDYYYRDVNPAYEKLVGKTKEQLINERVKDVFGAVENNWLKEYHKVITTAISSTSENYNANLKRYYKTKIWKVAENQVAIILEDITERKEIENAQLENQEIFENFMEKSPIYVFFKDENLRSLYLSKNYETMLNKPMKELLGKNMDELFPSDLAKNMVANDLKILKDNKEVRVEEKFNGRYYSTVKFPMYIEGKSPFLAGYTIDITERKLAEEKIKDSEQKYRALYENAPLSYQSLNEDGTFKDVNPFWLQTLGYERHEVIGEKYADFLHPDWKLHFEKNFPAFKKRGYVSDVKFRIRHKKGHYLDISFEGCIGYNPDGSFRQTYCVFQDITKRLKAENELADSLKREQSLGDIVRNAPISIAFGYPDGKLENCNKAFEVLTGYTEAELKTINWNDNLTPSHWRNIEEKALETLNSENNFIQYEKEYTHKNGAVIPVELFVYGKFDEHNKLLHYIGFIIDITERKEFLKKLQDRNEYIESVMEKMPIGFALNTIDDGDVKYMNNNFEKIYGWSQEILTNTSIFFEKVFPDPEYRREMTTQIISDMASKDPKKMVWKDLKVVTSTGEVRYVHAQNIPLINQNLMISTVQDTTLRKLEQDELLKHRENLEELVKERTKDLEDKNEELEMFNELFVDREFRIKELRDKLKKYESDNNLD